MPKKLVYKPTKIHPDAIAKLEKDVEKGKFASFNAGINAIINKHYKLKIK